VGVPLPMLGKLAPYSANGSSKHTNMASDGKRLYVSGGDWTYSATDGTWSAPLSNLADWRQDVGAPDAKTLLPVAPHALQDGAGFEWMQSRKRFLLWPGSYFAYEPAGAPLLDYARGAWLLDPEARTYTQDTRLFGKSGSNTGCLHGGVYDPLRDEIVAVGDDSTTPAVLRWNVETAKATSVPITVPGRTKGRACYFRRGKYALIGRKLYAIGLETDGEQIRLPIMLEFDLDTNAVRRCAAPPKGPNAVITLPDGKRKDQSDDKEMRLVVSHSKVVWPRTYGPEGDIDGIAVYDPKADAWSVDTQVPKVGAFICNAVCSLPDGRVVLAGGVFGKQQTHIWLYEAAA
jgi:hypothetical protein